MLCSTSRQLPKSLVGESLIVVRCGGLVMIYIINKAITIYQTIIGSWPTELGNSKKMGHFFGCEFMEQLGVVV